MQDAQLWLSEERAPLLKNQYVSLMSKAEKSNRRGNYRLLSLVNTGKAENIK